MKQTKKGGGAVALVGAALVLMVGLSQLVGLLGQWEALPQALRRLVLNPLALLLPAALLIRCAGHGRLPRMGKSRLPLGRLMGVFAPLVLWANLLADGLVRLLDTRGAGGAAMAAFGTAGEWVVTFLSACLLAPVAEELLFRGCVQPLLGATGTLPALVVTALLFALLHPTTAGLPGVLAAGFVLGAAALAGGSALPCVLLHGVNNLAALVLLTIGTLWGDDAAAIAALVLVAALVPVFVAAMRRVRRDTARPLFLAAEKGDVGLLASPVFLVGGLLVAAQFVLGLM